MNYFSVRSRKKIFGFVAVLILLFGVAANGASILNTPSTGYLLCVNTKTKVVTHPAKLLCPKGTKGLIVGAKGLDGSTGVPGLVGAAGINGRDGNDGKTLWNGTIDPENTWGAPGDIFINSATNTLFGPKKLDGTWPAGVSMIGPKGDQGLMGLPGVNGSNGSNGAQGPIGLTGAAGISAPVVSRDNCIGTKCTYKIGDTGPGGGIIFFVDYNDIYADFSYLEAAPENLSGEYKWSAENLLVSGAHSFAAQAVGRGQSNTNAIISSSLLESAARAADGYVAPSYNSVVKTDWFLGSLCEMKLLRDNTRGLTEFPGEYYLTSSEADGDGNEMAWVVNFVNDIIGYTTKDNLGRVRPLRRF